MPPLVRQATTLALRSPLTPARVGRLLLAQSLHSAIDGHTVMVTGASSGIGRATALRLAAAGACVLLVARREHELAELAEEIEAAGGTAFVHPCDLTDADAIAAMAADVLERHGPVDILVNNAGRSIRRPIAQSYDRLHDYERTMAINYFGAVALVLALLPAMREQGRGHVINISSGGVPTGAPRFSAYIASKAALEAFSSSMAAEVRGDGVAVTTIHFPLVRTPMVAPTKLYQRVPTLTPQEAAEWVAESIVTRPVRMSPRFVTAYELASAVGGGLMEAAMGTAYALFPDESQDSEERRERVRGLPAPARLVAKALRGPLW